LGRVPSWGEFVCEFQKGMKKKKIEKERIESKGFSAKSKIKKYTIKSINLSRKSPLKQKQKIE